MTVELLAVFDGSGFARIIPDFGGWRVMLARHLLPIAMWCIAAVLAQRAVNWTAFRLTTRIDAEFVHSDVLVRTESAKHQHALIQVLGWVAIALIYLLTAYSVVRLLGMPVTAMVAPATVVGAAVGFGAQRVVQDLLAGFFLMAERQYGFGDVVRLTVTGATYATGTVEDVTLRVTRLRTGDGEVITVPNGQIIKSTNLSKDWARATVDIPLPPNADVGKVNELLSKVGATAAKDPRLSPLLLDEPTVMGVESIDVDKLNMRMVARTLPGKQFEVSRVLRERIVRVLAVAGITVDPVVSTEGKEPQ